MRKFALISVFIIIFATCMLSACGSNVGKPIISKNDKISSIEIVKQKMDDEEERVVAITDEVSINKIYEMFSASELETLYWKTSEGRKNIAAGYNYNRLYHYKLTIKTDELEYSF